MRMESVSEHTVFFNSRKGRKSARWGSFKVRMGLIKTL